MDKPLPMLFLGGGKDWTLVFRGEGCWQSRVRSWWWMINSDSKDDLRKASSRSGWLMRVGTRISNFLSEMVGLVLP